MPQIMSVDKELYALVQRTREQLRLAGCRNPSYSNALRSLLDMPHISGKGKFDTCGTNMKISKVARVESPSEGSEEIIDLSLDG